MFNNILKVIISGDNSKLKQVIKESKTLCKDFSTYASVFALDATKDLQGFSSTELQDELEQVEAKLASVKANIKDLNEQWKEVNKTVETYQKKVNEARAVQQSWAEMGLPDEGRINHMFPSLEQDVANLESAMGDCEAITEGLLQMEDQAKNLSSNAETIKKRIKEIAKETKAANKEAKKSTGIVKALQGIFKRMIIFRAFSALLNKIWECIELLTRFDSALGNTLGYNKALSDLKSSFQRLSASISSLASELIVSLAPALIVVMDLLTKVVNFFTKIAAVFNGKTSYSVANPDYWQDYAESLNESTKAQRKLISGFDELNVYSSTNTSSSINPEDLYKTVEMEGAVKRIAELIGKIRTGLQNLFGDEAGNEIFSVGQLAAAFAGLLGVTKLLKNMFNKKNKSLETQTGDTQAETSAAWALVPAFAAVAAGAAALKEKLASLPSSLPSLQPQVETAPALSAIEVIKEAFSNVTLPSLVPTVAFTGITLGIAEIIKLFKKVELPELLPQFSMQPVTEFLAQVKEKFSNFKVPVLTPTVNTSPFVQAFAVLTTVVTNFWAKNKEKLTEGMTEFKNKWSEGLSTVLGNVKSWSANVVSNVGTALSNIKSNVTTFVSQTAASFKSWCSNTATNIKNATTNWAQNAYASLSSFGNNISTFITNTSSNFSKWCTNTAGNIKNWASNIASNVASSLSSAWQSFKSFMQATGEKVSGWWSANKTTVLTSAAIAAGITAAIALIPYTGGASLAALALAKGGVVDSPTMALVGEYPGAKSNPEIVTPESKMKEVMDASNGEMMSGFAQMTRQIISAIQNVDMNVSIGDDVIARSANRGNQSYKRMTGNALI